MRSSNGRAISRWFPGARRWNSISARMCRALCVRAAQAGHLAVSAAARISRDFTCNDNGPTASNKGSGEMDRSEEHTSELQSLMRISYAVFCLKKKTRHPHQKPTEQQNKMNTTYK